MSDQLKKAKPASRQSARSGRRLTKEQQAVPRKNAPREEREMARTAAAVITEEAPQRSAARRKAEPSPAQSSAAQFCETVRKKAQRARRRWRHIVREKRAKNFPESERAPIQLLLFAWSMLPMVGSRLREATWGRRKQAIHHVSHFRAWSEHHRIHPAAFLGVACGLAAIVMFCSFYTVGTTVTYDGEVIAAVSSKSAVEQACSNLEKVTTRTLGATYTIDDSQLLS